MGISPTEMSQQDLPAEPEVVKQEIAGRSPVQIAVGRLKSDKIAVACMIIVLFFVLQRDFIAGLTSGAVKA